MKRGHITNEGTAASPLKKLKEDQPYAGVITVHQQQQQHSNKPSATHPLFEKEKGLECPGHDVVAAIESIYESNSIEDSESESDDSSKAGLREKDQKAVSVIVRFLNKLRSGPSTDFSSPVKQPIQYNMFENNKHIYTGLAIVAKTRPELFLNGELLSGLAWLLNSANLPVPGGLPSAQGQNGFLQLFIANLYHVIYREKRLRCKEGFVGLDPLLVKAFFYDYFYDRQWSEDKRAEGFKEDVMRSLGDDFFTKLSAEEREQPTNASAWLQPPFEYRKRVGALLAPLFEEFFQRLGAFTHIKTYANAPKIIKSALSLPQVCVLTTRYAEGWTEDSLVGPAAGEIVDRIMHFVLHRGGSDDEAAFARDVVRNLTFYKQKNEHVLRCLRGILRGIPGMTEFALKELMFGICLKHMTFASKTFHVIYESAPKDENGKLTTDQLVCRNLIELTETSGVSKSNICELLKFIVGSFVKSPNKLFDIMDNIKRFLVVRKGPLSEAERQKVTSSMDNVIHLCCFSIVLGYILTKSRTEKLQQSGSGASIGMAKYFAFARDVQGYLLSWLAQMLPQWSKDRKVVTRYMRQVLMLVKPEIIDGNALMDAEKKVGLVIFDKQAPLSFPVSEQLLLAVTRLIRDCSETPGALGENFKVLESIVFRGLEFLGTETKVAPLSFSDPKGFVHEVFSLARLKGPAELFDVDTIWSCAVVVLVLAAIDPESLGAYVWENVPIVATLMEMVLTENWGIRPLAFSRGAGCSEAEMEAADRAEVAKLAGDSGSLPEGRTFVAFNVQQPRRPPEEVLKSAEVVVARYPLVRRRLLGKRSFFEGILSGQSLESLMEWLPELIHRNGEMAAALPSKLLCEMLLSPRFCDPERSHCVKRIRACATSRDSAQQSEGLDVLMFFLECLGSPRCAMRENARSVLTEVFGSLEAFMRTELLASSPQRLSEACQKLGNAIFVETRPEVIAKYIAILVGCREVFPVQDTLMKLCFTLASRPLTRRVLFADGENGELLQRTAEGLIALYFSTCGAAATQEALAGISLFFGVSKRRHTDALSEDLLANLFRDGGVLSMFSVRDLVLMWAESEDPVVCAAGVSKLEPEDLVALICTPGHAEQTVSLAAEHLAQRGPLAKETYASVSRCLELYGLGNMIDMFKEV